MEKKIQWCYFEKETNIFMVSKNMNATDNLWACA